MRDKAEVIQAEVQPRPVGSADQVRKVPAPKIGKDKILHVICCFAIAIGLAGIIRLIGLNPSASGVIGFFAALIAGVAKEVYDVYQSLNPSSFSWKDILADVIGTVAGSALWFILTAGAFDFEQFLIYGFACSLLSVFLACFSFPFIAVAMERKSMKKK